MDAEMPIQSLVQHHLFSVSLQHLVRHRHHGESGTASHGLVCQCPAMLLTPLKSRWTILLSVQYGTWTNLSNRLPNLKGQSHQILYFMLCSIKYYETLLRENLHFFQIFLKVISAITKEFLKAANTHMNGFLQTIRNLKKKSVKKLSNPGIFRDPLNRY